ncbi:MAG: proton-conducting transporter membrane subunit, partial [bacterium]
YWTYLIAALAISGAPLTAGFFSKDQILWQAFASPQGSLWLWLLAWLTAGLTALYMFRQFFLIFHGPCKVAEKIGAHIHESPWVMTLPLMLLAAGSVFAGWLGAPAFLWGSVWDQWLQPVFGRRDEAVHGTIAHEILFMFLTLVIAGLGFFLAYLFYYRARKIPERLSSGAAYRLLLDKYHVDELYDVLFVTPLHRAAVWLANIVDTAFIDGIVHGVANRVRDLSLSGRRIQTGNVQHYLFGFLAGTMLILAYYLYR